MELRPRQVVWYVETDGGRVRVGLGRVVGVNAKREYSLLAPFRLGFYLPEKQLYPTPAEARAAALRIASYFLTTTQNEAEHKASLARIEPFFNFFNTEMSTNWIENYTRQPDKLTDEELRELFTALERSIPNLPHDQRWAAREKQKDVKTELDIRANKRAERRAA